MVRKGLSSHPLKPAVRAGKELANPTRTSTATAEATAASNVNTTGEFVVDSLTMERIKRKNKATFALYFVHSLTRLRGNMMETSSGANIKSIVGKRISMSRGLTVRTRKMAFATILMTVLMGASLPSLADGENSPAACAWNEAEYVPSLEYKAGEPPLSYRLIIKKNPEYHGSTYNTELFFILETSDANTGKLANTLTMPYGCGGGSLTACSIDVSSGNYDRLYIQVLNRFSSLGYTDGIVPYALIIPHAYYVFEKLNWKKANIKYEKGSDEDLYNRVHRPNLSVPSVWVFNKCNKTEG